MNYTLEISGKVTYHQTNLEKVRRNTHKYVDLPEEVEIQRCHTIVIRDPGEEVHEDELTVSFSSITWLLLRRGLLLCTALDHDDSGSAASSDS